MLLGSVAVLAELGEAMAIEALSTLQQLRHQKPLSMESLSERHPTGLGNLRLPNTPSYSPRLL